MSMNTTRIIEAVSKDRFKRIISKYKNNIHVSPHAFFHLNDAQRDVYNEQHLINILLQERPHLIGLQKNGRYAAFYKRKDHYLRLILEIKETKIELVTFINTEYIPHIKRMKK